MQEQTQEGNNTKSNGKNPTQNEQINTLKRQEKVEIRQMNVPGGGTITQKQINEKETKQHLHDKNINEIKIQTSEEKIKDLTITLQKLQAEFENYQKRNAKQNEEYKNYANAKLIEELLPVLDTLEAGMTHDKELVRVYNQLFSILKKQGLEKIKAETGMKFNHDTMECMLSEKNSAVAEDAVASVLITGYVLNGKILRPVKVSVNLINKKNAVAEENEDTSKDIVDNNRKEMKGTEEEKK